MDQSAEKDIIRNYASSNHLVKEVSKPPMLEEMPEELEDDARRKKMTRKILKSPRSRIPMMKTNKMNPKPLERKTKQVANMVAIPAGDDMETGHLSEKLIV